MQVSIKRIVSENLLKGLSVGTVRKCAVLENNQKLGALDPANVVS
jgi:hypothetical protein